MNEPRCELCGKGPKLGRANRWGQYDPKMKDTPAMRGLWNRLQQRYIRKMCHSGCWDGFAQPWYAMLEGRAPGCVVCQQPGLYDDHLMRWKNDSWAHLGCAADVEYAQVESEREEAL